MYSKSLTNTHLHISLSLSLYFFEASYDASESNVNVSYPMLPTTRFRTAPHPQALFWTYLSIDLFSDISFNQEGKVHLSKLLYFIEHRSLVLYKLLSCLGLPLSALLF